MKKLASIRLLTVVCCALSGCMLPTSDSTIHRWQSRVNTWLPVGTPVDEVRRIMERQGFDCTAVQLNGMSCDKVTVHNVITVYLFIVDGKIASAPVTDVMPARNF